MSSSARCLSILILSFLGLLGTNNTIRAADLSGNWTGTWESTTSGHHGPLKATFCAIDETHCRVQFRGRFFKVIPFRFNVVLEVTGQEGDKALLAGEAKLGLFWHVPLYGGNDGLRIHCAI